MESNMTETLNAVTLDIKAFEAAESAYDNEDIWKMWNGENETHSMVRNVALAAAITAYIKSAPSEIPVVADEVEHVAEAVFNSRHKYKWDKLVSIHPGSSKIEKYRNIAKVAIAAMCKPKRESRKLSDPPCDQCGYNGVGYYQPEMHPCAAKHH